MRDYTNKDVTDWLNNERHIMTHYIVAHTQYSAKDKPVGAIEDIKSKTGQYLNHALNRMAKRIHKGHGNRVTRRPHEYRPATIATIEGLKPSEMGKVSVHINLMIGNLPKEWRHPARLGTLFEYCWADKCGQRRNIMTQDYDDRPDLTFYICKANTQPGSISDSLALEATHLPRSPLFAD